jgi:Ca-activated chloride channel family protein
MTLRAAATLITLLVVCSTAHAELPPFLRKQNSEVNNGNDALQKGDAKGALEAYNRAARTLPDAPGVQLDRGLALLKQGDNGKAREALLAATVPSAPTDVRADAYEDLALSFYREADGLAGQDKHADAQKLFREAVDAGKRSLHLRPRNPNAAWNLELAARRVREEEQKQKQQEEQDKEKKKQDDQQKSDEQNKDQNQNDDSSNQDQPKQDQKQGDKKPEDDQQAKQDGKNDKKGEQKPEPQKPPEQPKNQDRAGNSQPEGDKKEAPPEQALPREASQALDSLEDGEENFERYRARQRASRERRAPDKDW